MAKPEETAPRRFWKGVYYTPPAGATDKEIDEVLKDLDAALENVASIEGFDYDEDWDEDDDADEEEEEL